MPGWNWIAKDKQGKQRTGYTEGRNIVTPQILRDHLRQHFHALDYSDFKCEEGPPRKILMNVPPEWYEYGTNRMKLEIDAGIRPFSEYLLPPINIERRETIPTRVGLLRPWRERPL